MANPSKLEMFKPEAIITVDLSVPFFSRIQQIVLTMVNDHPPAEAKAAVEKIKAGSPLLPWEENLETLLILINGVEAKARADGSLEMKEITAQGS